MRCLWLSVLYAFAYHLCHVSALFNPVREHAGATFFDGWAYYGNVDNTTWGNVTFLDQPSAKTKGLTFVNDAGNAIIKVDNTTTLSPPTTQGEVVNRDSIRLTSIDSYGIGSLLIIDAVHIPYGCSVWPSFWTYGMQEEWPQAGEIDIIEAINNMDHNQIALHTPGGCFQAPNPGQTGSTIEHDCSTDRGCIVAETKPNSYGAGFAQAGGGVYAVQTAATGVYAWFWSRADIPDNVKSATSTSDIDISNWGLPTAAYPSTACNTTQYFPPQNLVLLTTLCGVWAGVPSIYQSSCHTTTNSCFNDNVVGPPSTFDNAYWEIRYVRTYLSDDAPKPSTSSSISSSTESTASSAATSQPPRAPPISSSFLRFYPDTVAILSSIFAVVLVLLIR